MKFRFSYIALILFILLNSKIKAQEKSDEEQPQAERWFQIELIIFKRTAKDGFKSEQWPDNPPLPDTKNAIDFLSPVPDFDNPPSEQNETFNNSVKLADKDSGNQLSEDSLDQDQDQDKNKKSYPSVLVTISHNESLKNQLNNASEPDKTMSQGFFSFLDQVELPFRNITNPDYQLSPHVGVLKRDKSYKVIRYLSWHQPVFDKTHTTSVRVFGGKDYIDEYNLRGMPRLLPQSLKYGETGALANENNTDKVNETTTLSPLNNESMAIITPKEDEQPEQEIPFDFSMFKPAKKHLWEFDGVFKIYLKRYLHVEIDMVMRHPATKEVSQNHLGQLNSFNFDENKLQNLDDQSNKTDENNLPHLNYETDFDENLLSIQTPEESSIYKMEYLKAYLMDQKRRIRSKKIHFFDHPLMGAILLVTPYDPILKLPEQETDQDKN